jgi:hypothetical protein
MGRVGREEGGTTEDGWWETDGRETGRDPVGIGAEEEGDGMGVDSHGVEGDERGGVAREEGGDEMGTTGTDER